MRHLETGDGQQFIEDSFGKITARKNRKGRWERTFPSNEYSLAPNRKQALSAEVVKENDISPDKKIPALATRPIYHGDFSQVDEAVRKHGLLPVVRTLSPWENAALSRHLIEQGDPITASAIREEVERFAYGSHGFTSEPEVAMKQFDQIVKEGIK